MDRAEKEQRVGVLRNIFENANLIVLVHQTGLSVAAVTGLREEMRAAQAGFRVVKNTLARRAVRGTRFAYLADAFTGPTAIGFSEDPIAAAKALAGFCKDNPAMRIVSGGLFDQMLDADGVMALAKLPPLDSLRGKLVGLIQAPAGGVARVLAAPGGQVARVLGAYGASS